MPLGILDILTQTGRNGRTGTDGASTGAGGSDGRPGLRADLRVESQTFTGDPGDDSVRIVLTTQGGRGGTGGQGAAGFDPGPGDPFNQSGPDFTFSETSWGLAGTGGSGGRGGGGGVARSVFDTLTFNLLGATAQPNRVDLQAQATGGSGGFAGFAGRGGNSVGNIITTTQIGDAPDLFTDTVRQNGTPGGEAGISAQGGGGNLALSTFDTISLTGDRVVMQMSGTATGGSGGSGAFGVLPGSGSAAPVGRDGGDGGAGGAALARSTDLIVNVTGGLSLGLSLSATGGRGGNGENGAAAGFGTSQNQLTLNAIGGRTDTTIYGEAGSGGNGGQGGDAEAQVTGARITGSAANDQVTLTLSARGGDGGRGGAGGTGADSSLTVAGDPDFTITTVVQGTLDGNDGLAGGAGASIVTLKGNRVSLEDGTDVLSIALTATGNGPRSFDVERNTFDGGAGFDTLRLGTFAGTGQPDVFVNVDRGRLVVAGGGNNTITGFERFEGGAGNDRFVDGIGDQVYAGRGGADRFEFLAGNDGNDRIEGFDGFSDVIALRAFGGALNSFADVQAAATNTANGVLITTSATSSVLLAGVTLAQLAADDFAF